MRGASIVRNPVCGIETEALAALNTSGSLLRRITSAPPGAEKFGQVLRETVRRVRGSENAM